VLASRLVILLFSTGIMKPFLFSHHLHTFWGAVEVNSTVQYSQRKLQIVQYMYADLWRMACTDTTSSPILLWAVLYTTTAAISSEE
jgi:hypothetical protein